MLTGKDRLYLDVAKAIGYHRRDETATIFIRLEKGEVVCAGSYGPDGKEANKFYYGEG